MGLRCSFTTQAAVVVGLVATAHAAEVCNPNDLNGAYGLQMAGSTTIGGRAQPIAVIGRIVFGYGGSVSGVSSVNFNGFFLGNPVTGKYEANADCSMTLSLQVDSGGNQEFHGRVRPGGDRADVQQTDTGTGERGVLSRTPESCSAATFQGNYNFQLSGSATPFNEDTPATMPGSATVEANGNGGLTLTRGSVQTNGTYTVDSECFVQLDIGLPDAESALVKLRGILVGGGKEVLVVATDPERVGSGRFTAK